MPAAEPFVVPQVPTVSSPVMSLPTMIVLVKVNSMDDPDEEWR